MASTAASMRVEFNDAMTRTRSNVLAELDKTRIEVTGLADRQSGLFTELGKTRSAPRFPNRSQVVQKSG